MSRPRVPLSLRPAQRRDRYQVRTASIYVPKQEASEYLAPNGEMRRRLAGPGYVATLIRGKPGASRWPIIWRCPHVHGGNLVVAKQAAFECAAAEMTRRRGIDGEPVAGVN